MIEYKASVTTGELLQIISFLLAVFAVYNRITLQINEIVIELRPMLDWWNKSNLTAREYADSHRSATNK